jgi:hypothetical protein
VDLRPDTKRHMSQSDWTMYSKNLIMSSIVNAIEGPT